MEQFSERIGATQPKRQLQLDEMDEGLKNALWNWMCWLFDHRANSHNYAMGNWRKFAEIGLWDAFFHLRIDEIPEDVQRHVKTWFFAHGWWDAYNLVEFALDSRYQVFDVFDSRQQSAERKLNHYLEREMSGWRSIKRQLVAVTSPAEIASIQDAATPKKGFEGVAEHIQSAMALLGQRPEPDTRNCIKEAISAVEGAAKLLTSQKSGGIDDALAILDKQKKLHPAFRLALSKLYSYTSDEDGIRHPILEETTVTFAEARFMLVACSAFANLLIENSGRPA